MQMKKSIIALVLSSAVGLATTAAWSQQAPGEARQPDRNRTKSGDDPENVPGVQQKGTPELSQSDMKKVEEALQAKGYKVGKIDGMADDDARKAIRAFQQDNGLSATGVIDQRTADKLGVKITAKAGSPQRSSTGGMSGQPKSPTGESDQNVPPPSGTRR